MNILGFFPSPNGPAFSTTFAGIDEELRFLRKMVSQYRQTPQIRNLAVKIIKDAGVPMNDKRGQALAVADWVQQHVYYVHELPERFQTPAETPRLAAGDCDDFTTLISSLIESIGIPAKLVCLKWNGSYQHIFPAANLPQGLLPLDATLKNLVHDLTNPVALTQQGGRAVVVKLA